MRSSVRARGAHPSLFAQHAISVRGARRRWFGTVPCMDLVQHRADGDCLATEAAGFKHRADFDQSTGIRREFDDGRRFFALPAAAVYINHGRVVINLRIDGKIERGERFEKVLEIARLNGDGNGNQLSFAAMQGRGVRWRYRRPDAHENPPASGNVGPKAKNPGPKATGSRTSFDRPAFSTFFYVVAISWARPADLNQST